MTDRDMPRLPPPRERAALRDGLCVGLLLLITAALWAPRLRGPIDIRYDGAVYYVLGTSIAEGKGYRLLNEPGDAQAVQYPPLLPLVVAAHQKVLGTSDILVVGPWLRRFYLLLSAALAVATYALARRWLTWPYALAAAVVCALSQNIVVFSDELYTEIPFALLGVGFVMFLSTPRRQPDPVSADAAGSPSADEAPTPEAVGPAPRWRGVLAGVIAVAAYFLRTAGLALLVTWVADSLLRRRFRAAAVRAAVSVAAVLAWNGYVRSVTSGEEYRQPAYAYQRAAYQFWNVPYQVNVSLRDPFVPESGATSAGDVALRVARSLKGLPGAIGEAVAVSMRSWTQAIETFTRKAGLETEWASRFAQVAVYGLAALVLGGGVLLFLRREKAIPIYFVVTAAMVCLTPWPEQLTRYLTPLSPLLCVMAAVALAWLAGPKVAACRWCGYPAVVVAALIGLAALYAEARALSRMYRGPRSSMTFYDADGRAHTYRSFFYSTDLTAMDHAFEWVRIHSNDGDVVATSIPQVAHVRTGRKAVLPPMVADPSEAQRLLDSVPVRYLVVDEVTYPDICPRYVRPLVKSHESAWRHVYRAPESGTDVYERVNPTAGGF